ncbi:DUF3108 domain-containing protein [Duganella sp. Root198D2]|uniref:DUF3108 domain-containing protein n=1 Tax=Duganella sp. Root198D2 TaxID=1736489 RepID=UPI00070D4941|nr:DUF3108 domain-containing protein [Duganella sp. Root198D2]KRB83323.1 hypothetical protein ASE26_12670 [Duganella sp. Root198D2]
MTIVTLPRHRRRIIAICAATVALHFVTINWVSGRIGAAERERDTEKNVISAELRPPPPPDPVVPEPVKAPPPKPKPKPKPKPPKPAPPPEEAAPVGEPAPAETAPAEPEAAAQGGQAGAAPATAGVESAQAQPEAAPQAEPPAELTRWKVALPPSARFELDVRRKDADGTNWSGSASIGWQTDGASYKATQEVGISLLIARVNLLEVNSEGTINEFGIAPAKFSEKRRNRSATATHFNQQEQKITFSASERSVPLTAGAQDRATVLFQLAGIGRADVNQFGKPMEILVGEDRNAQVYSFLLVGEDEIETKMGKLVTWHLARPPKPGSYSARLDIWLAPSLDWYPVQIRNTESNGAVTTQTVTRIIK